MDTGLSVAIGYLNPCGLDSLHIHNRAHEVVTLVAGKSLKTGFVLEDGFDLPVYTEIGLYQATIRPQGSQHWEFNDHCESAVFVASLSNEVRNANDSTLELFRIRANPLRPSSRILQSQERLRTSSSIHNRSSKPI